MPIPWSPSPILLSISVRNSSLPTRQGALRYYIPRNLVQGSHRETSAEPVLRSCSDSFLQFIYLPFYLPPDTLLKVLPCDTMECLSFGYSRESTHHPASSQRWKNHPFPEGKRYCSTLCDRPRFRDFGCML